MRRWLRLGVAVAAALGCVSASACGLVGSSATKVTIPADAAPGDATYTLLYSTLGYESLATKRILIRQNDTAVQASQGLAFGWQLIDAKGSEVEKGIASFAGNAWTIPLWSLDFSKVHKPGTYRVLVEAPGVTLATDPFQIDEFLLFESTYLGVALDNAEARAAPLDMDGGYFTDNGRGGPVDSHATFLVGLLESFDRRRTSLTDDQRMRARAAIDRAVDYLLLLSDPQTGEIDGQSSTRPDKDFSAQTTAEGLRGLAHFASLARTDEPDKADRAYRRAKLAETWLLTNAPEAYPPSLQAAVDYDLYRAIGDQATLDKAKAAVRAAVTTYDLRTMDRGSYDALPHFEAMHAMWLDLRDDPDRPFWEETAKRVALQYEDMIVRNVFQVVPPGVTSVDDGTDAARQWDQVATLPLPGEGVDAVIGNDWFMARAIDAVYLSQMSGDKMLEKVATANLEWISGLNPGVPSNRVIGAGTASPFAAASFLTGMPVRTARTWSEWQWQRPKPFATIVGGFRSTFVYDDIRAAGDTSISRDGLWLYATSVYEDALNAGKHPPQLAGSATFEPGARITAAFPSKTETTFALLVGVQGPDSKPLEGALVTVAWRGAASPDVSPDEAVRVSECVTAANGACAATIARSDLAAQAPLSAAITNVEHPAYAYDVTSAPAPAMFP